MHDPTPILVSQPPRSMVATATRDGVTVAVVHIGKSQRPRVTVNDADDTRRIAQVRVAWKADYRHVVDLVIAVDKAASVQQHMIALAAGFIVDEQVVEFNDHLGI